MASFNLICTKFCQCTGHCLLPRVTAQLDKNRFRYLTHLLAQAFMENMVRAMAVGWTLSQASASTSWKQQMTGSKQVWEGGFHSVQLGMKVFATGCCGCWILMSLKSNWTYSLRKNTAKTMKYKDIHLCLDENVLLHILILFPGHPLLCSIRGRILLRLAFALIWYSIMFSKPKAVGFAPCSDSV